LVESRGIRFNAHPVVHGVPGLLFASEVALGCLNRDMSEQELDLVQFATGEVTQPRARASQIVRREVGGLQSVARQIAPDSTLHRLSRLNGLGD